MNCTPPNNPKMSICLRGQCPELHSSADAECPLEKPAGTDWNETEAVNHHILPYGPGPAHEIHHTTENRQQSIVENQTNNNFPLRIPFPKTEFPYFGLWLDGVN